MTEEFGKLTAPRFKLKSRRAISHDPASLVRFEPSDQQRSLPVIARPVTNGVDLVTWVESSVEHIRSTLLKAGAILFRGFDVRSLSVFESFINAAAGQPLPYLERSSPRTPAGGNIYSSTEYPAEQSIFPHCENSYQKTWPQKIFFYCASPALQGGDTPIADTRRILERIDPVVREKFAAQGVLYVRNFGPGLGLSWETVFQTSDREIVEQYCVKAGIEYRWKGADQLCTRQVRKAIRVHPLTGEEVWFNHAVFFHISTLDVITQQVLQASVAAEDLPNNTYYGDGSEIEPIVLDQLRTTYKEETVRIPWHQGDILMLDNMLVAHGRDPYQGSRRVLVGMAELYSD